MDYNILLDLATGLGYRLAMAGAETFRVEESINRVMAAYGIGAEVFFIPNCLIVSIETDGREPMTRMCRIGYHGNDLDSVERYSNLSRRICGQKPEPQTALAWMEETDRSKTHYSPWMQLFGSFLGAFGFAFLFGGSWKDGLCAGICGIIVGLINLMMDSLKANLFFRTIFAAFCMAVPAYALFCLGLADKADAVIIGTLMLLVPGLIFTNAMRDIIFGDTNSGINRIVQVFLIAAAIALGTGTAWTVSTGLWAFPVPAMDPGYGYWIHGAACFAGCAGFCILFNIHGHGGLLCIIGGILTWGAYSLILSLGLGDIPAYFWATVLAAVYAEVMARIRKYPAISYLVVSIFPLIPGAGIYYTMNHVLQKDLNGFAQEGTHTIAVAGVMAVAILLVSTVMRLWTTWRHRKAVPVKR